jgi:phytoene/squalene synthetase
VVVARALYAAILDRIEAQGYDVFSRRAETSRAAKLRIAAAVAARNPWEVLRLPGRGAGIAMAPRS